MTSLAHRSRAFGAAREEQPLLSLGVTAGLVLLVLPPLIVVAVRLLEPGNPVFTRILGFETVLIVTVQVALSIVALRRAPTEGVLRLLVPAAVAGGMVAAGDILASSLAFGTPTVPGTVSVVAYDLVFGVFVAAPLVVVLRAAWRCRDASPKSKVDASPSALISAYDRVRAESTAGIRFWQVRTLLCHQLLLRHVRKTLEAVQRGYARRAVERGLDEADARDRRRIDDYLLSVPTVSKVVPIPTVATIFLLWKLVPTVLAVAAGAAEWFSGGRLGLATVSAPIGRVVPDQIASFVTNSLALAVAFVLLMLVLAPAIHRRDRLLARHEVCEREVILMDDHLGYKMGRSSRRFEYVMAALPALPFALYGAAVLAYAVAGLFVYPSPQGPLGNLVERADVMHLGPVTGAVLAQVFLGAAAAWIAWIVQARRETRVVLL
jgi:hypothetical protein